MRSIADEDIDDAIKLQKGTVLPSIAKKDRFNLNYSKGAEEEKRGSIGDLFAVTDTAVSAVGYQCDRSHQWSSINRYY